TTPARGRCSGDDSPGTANCGVWHREASFCRPDPQAPQDPGGDVADDGFVDVAGALVLGGPPGSVPGDEQVVQRRIAVEGDVAPRPQRSLPPRELLHRHLIVA